MNINDLVITSVETITVFDYATEDYAFTLDELQSVNIANSEEKQDVTGKMGRKLSSLKRNKALKVSGNNGLVSSGLLEMQTGSKFENKDTEILWTDYLTVDSNSATTKYKAIGTAGAEIEKLYVRDKDSAVANLTFTQGSTAGDGTFAYTPADKKITFKEGALSNGTDIVVLYKRKINANVLESTTNSYAGKCMMYIDVLAEGICSDIYRVQFFVPKMEFNGDFGFDLGGNQSVHAFEANSLSGAVCGDGEAVWTYTVFGADAADA